MSGILTDIIDLIHPTSSGIGIVTNDTIWVLFDREVDETTIEDGNFFLTGPDNDILAGPDLQLFKEDSSTTAGINDILESPGFQGIVQGSISFERILNSSLTVTTGLDTIGSGHLFRTKAIFTPNNRLQSNTEYVVYLSADEDVTDTIESGISERTVYDSVASGANTGVGEGSVTFEGGYIGSSDDVFRIIIHTAGDVGTAKFTFRRDSDPGVSYGPFKTKRSGTLLSDGVTVKFAEGSYAVGDQYSVIVKAPDYFIGNFQWTFKTGSGNILLVPETTSTTVLGDLPASVTDSTAASLVTSFEVSSTSPTDGTTNLELPSSSYNITATFSNDIDSSTISSGVTVKVYSEPVDGSPDGAEYLAINPSVSDESLTITVASGEIIGNRLITITLTDDISDTSGNFLDEDYTFSFSTRYDPLYCTVRRLRLFIGAFVKDIPDDTLNLSIYFASLAADALTWNSDNTSDSYYQFARAEWTCCRAAEILLFNLVGSSGSLKSKRLGDLSVSYDQTILNRLMDKIQNCLAKWEGAVMAGGRQVQTMEVVVKGILDPDKPDYGRGWAHEGDIGMPGMPMANTRGFPPNGGRRLKKTHISKVNGTRPWWRR